MIIDLSRLASDCEKVSISDLATVIENTGIAHYDGHHIICIRPPELSRIISRTGRNISPRALNALKSAASRYPEISGLAQRLGLRAEVHVEALSTGENAVWAIRDNDIIAVSHRFFIPSESIAPTHLLCEHGVRDCDFYERCGDAFAYREKVPGVRLALRRLHGGGSSTFEILGAQATRSVFTACIVDSDRSYPSDSYGATARKCGDILGRSDSRVHVEVLNVRAFENVVPHNLCVDALQSAGRPIDRLMVFSPHIWNFAPLKSPIKGCFVFRLHQNVEATNIWHGRHCSVPPQCDVCTGVRNDLSCAGVKSKCTCIVFEGLTDEDWGAIHTAIGRFSKKIFSDRVLGHSEDARTIGEFVLQWCCGGQPLLRAAV